MGDRRREGVRRELGTPLSEVCLVVARVDGGVTSVILVPRDSRGFAVGPARRGVGLAGDQHDLVFDGCRVPERNLLGGSVSVDRELLGTLDDERIAVGALSVGLVRGCLEEAGQGSAGPGSAGSGSAGLRAASEAARLAYLRAARLRDRGLSYEVEAATMELLSLRLRDLLPAREPWLP